MLEGTAESRSEPSCTRKKENPYDAATSTKLLNIAATACLTCSSAEETEKEGTNHLSYSGAIEVGEGEDGRTKSVAGTGVSSVDGTGDIACASSSEEFVVETLAVCYSADHTGKKKGYSSTFVVVRFSPDRSCFICCEIAVAGNTGGNNALAATSN